MISLSVMNILLLPGFSLKNRVWAEKTKFELEHKYQITIHYWKHWNTGTADPNWISNEVDLILKSLPGQKVNILAKSIGTLVASIIIKAKAPIVNKIILCGIPVNDIEEKDKVYYKYLNSLPAENVLCIQNEGDPHGRVEDVTLLLSKINRNIKIMSKPSSDHEYPYTNEFLNFFR